MIQGYTERKYRILPTTEKRRESNARYRKGSKKKRKKETTTAKNRNDILTKHCRGNCKTQARTHKADFKFNPLAKRQREETERKK